MSDMWEYLMISLYYSIKVWGWSQIETGSSGNLIVLGGGIEVKDSGNQIWLVVLHQLTQVFTNGPGIMQLELWRLRVWLLEEDQSANKGRCRKVDLSRWFIQARSLIANCINQGQRPIIIKGEADDNRRSRSCLIHIRLQISFASCLQFDIQFSPETIHSTFAWNELWLFLFDRRLENDWGLGHDGGLGPGPRLHQLLFF